MAIWSWLLAAFLAAQALDGGTTWWKLSQPGYREGNRFLPRSPQGIVLTKTAVASTAIVVAWRLKTRHPRLAKGILCAGLVGGSLGTIITLRADARRPRQR